MKNFNNNSNFNNTNNINNTIITSENNREIRITREENNPIREVFLF